MTKAEGKTISRADLKSILLSSLAEQGLGAAEADRLSDQQVAKVWKNYGGRQPYFRKDHQGKETAEHRRKVIFMEWWTHRPTGDALQVFLTNWNIGERRLQQIQAEGRKRKWAV